LDRVLDPLLDCAREYRDSIFAFEVINEPEWVVRGGPLHFDVARYGVWPSAKTVEPHEMDQLIAQSVGRIGEAGLVATVGFLAGAPRWLSRRTRALLAEAARAGRYVDQRHHYPTWLGPYRLPEHDRNPIRPCVLGELPTAIGGTPTNARFRDRETRVSETQRDRYLEGRLSLADLRGYPVTLLWGAKSRDNRSAWGPDQQRQVARFVSGQIGAAARRPTAA
jgi:hypothetical protein